MAAGTGLVVVATKEVDRAIGANNETSKRDTGFAIAGGSIGRDVVEIKQGLERTYTNEKRAA